MALTLTAEERQRIDAAIAVVEQKTSADLDVMVMRASDRYSLYPLVWAGFGALAVAGLAALLGADSTAQRNNHSIAAPDRATGGLDQTGHLQMVPFDLLSNAPRKAFGDATILDRRSSNVVLDVMRLSLDTDRQMVLVRPRCAVRVHRP